MTEPQRVDPPRRSLTQALGQAWLHLHGPSYLWVMAARRWGWWYAARMVRARWATPAELDTVGLDPPGGVTVVRGTSPGPSRPGWLAPRLWAGWYRFWYPEPHDREAGRA